MDAHSPVCHGTSCTAWPRRCASVAETNICDVAVAGIVFCIRCALRIRPCACVDPALAVALASGTSVLAIVRGTRSRWGTQTQRSTIVGPCRGDKIPAIPFCLARVARPTPTA
jgi:hypothetical protein